MFKYYKNIFHFLLLVITVITVCSTGSPFLYPYRNQMCLQESNLKSENNLPTISKAIQGLSLLSCHVLEGAYSDLLVILKKSKSFQTVKHIICGWLLSILYKGPSQGSLVVYLTKVQYFIVDLRISILSSRSHPPTL